jgi:diguanylate cyclase (GGDEF)-like protein
MIEARRPTDANTLSPTHQGDLENVPEPAPMQPGMKARDLRHETRLQTRVRARAVIDGGKDIPVLIVDYCQAGLYLRIDDAEEAQTYDKPATGTHLVVRFTSDFGTAREYFVEGHVAHGSVDGIGVHATAMPGSVRQALKRLTESEPAPPPPPTEEPPPPIQDAEAINKACHEAILQALPDMLDDYFARLVVNLAQAQEQARFTDQPRHQYASRLLQARRGSIVTTFLARALEQLRGCEAGQVQATSQGPSLKGELALVDDAEFENWLALTGIINQVEGSLEDMLSQLQIRYGGLIGQAISHKNLPFGPEVLGRLIGEALNGLDIQGDIRQIAYKSFGESLRANLPTLYATLLSRLAPLADKLPMRILHKDEGTPPPGDSSPPPPSTEAEVKTAPTEPTTRHALPELDALLRDIFNEIKPTPEELARQAAADAQAYTLRHILQALGRRGYVRVGHGPRGADASRGEPWPPVGHTPNLFPLARRLHIAYRDLADRHWPGENRDDPDAPVPEALLTLLDTMPDAEHDAASGKGSGLCTRLLRHLEYETDAPRDGDRATLSALERLIEHISKEHAATSRISHLLGKLERPLARVALCDPSILDDTLHPARRLVSLLDQYAIATDDRGHFFDSRLHRFLDTLVDHVADSVAYDPSVIGKACVYLERMLNPVQRARRRRVNQLRENIESRERVKAAHERVRNMLDAELGGRVLPYILERLLDVGWRQHLILRELRLGVDHAEWRDDRQMLNSLMDWLGAHGDKPAPSGQDACRLFERLHAELAAVNTDPEQVDAFMRDLEDDLRRHAHGETIEKYKKPKRRGKADDAKVSHPAPAIVAWLDVGRWWSIRQVHATQPFQLIWASKSLGRCTFTDRSASRTLDFTLEQIENLARSGALIPLDDKAQPLFERALRAVIDEAYLRLARAARRDAVTGLANRIGFMSALHAAARRQEERPSHVCILRFDQVRAIRERYGKEAGQALSRRLAEVIGARLGEDDILAAIGNDSFALLSYQPSRAKILEFAGKLLKHFQEFHFEHEGKRHPIGINIGLAEYSALHACPEDVVHEAEEACAIARKAGRNRIQRHVSGDARARAQKNLSKWLEQPGRDIGKHTLYLRCQRIAPVDPNSELTSYHEILLGARIDGEEIPARAYLSAAEHLGRGTEIDRWVLDATFAWIEANPDEFRRAGGFAIHLIPASISDPDFIRYVHDKLDGASFPLDRITFVISAPGHGAAPTAARAFMRRVGRHGCAFSFDDPGIGHITLEQIRHTGLDSLKIAGLYVRDCQTDPAARSLVRAMHAIGHALGLKTVAPCTETPETIAALAEIGVDYASGHAVHADIPLAELGKPGAEPANPAPVEAVDIEAPAHDEAVEPDRTDHDADVAPDQDDAMAGTVGIESLPTEPEITETEAIESTLSESPAPDAAAPDQDSTPPEPTTPETVVMTPPREANISSDDAVPTEPESEPAQDPAATVQATDAPESPASDSATEQSEQTPAPQEKRRAATTKAYTWRNPKSGGLGEP